MINGAYVAVLFEQNLLVFDELPKLPKTVPPYLGENRFSPDRHLYSYNKNMFSVLPADIRLSATG
ncbi:MAG: hypothetical protein ACI9EW_002429 [Cellvibrionaceae bacterium]|jgi:hypothetical protein